MTFTFAPATREGTHARIALAGPSGSGKTWTSLLIAHELTDRIAVIDTERRSARKYAGPDGVGFPFDVLELTTYEPLTLVGALGAAGADGYGAVIVDSLSHFWMGTGGMLEQVDNAARRSHGGNSFGGWKEARPMERGLIDALLAYPGHVIVTMRTKTEWVVEQNDKGKQVPRKIGTKPEQREGIEYEFDLVGDLDLEHTLVVTKSRMTTLADLVAHKPGPELGQQILAWLGDAPPAVTALDLRDRALELVDVADLRALWSEARQLRLDGAAVMDEHGDTGTLGALITRRADELQRASRPTGDDTAGGAR